MADVLRPLVAQHLGSSPHLQLEGLGKRGIAQHVVPHTLVLVSMAGRLGSSGTHFHQRLVAVVDTLVYNVQRQFALVRLSLVFLLDILNQFLALRAATLVEARIDGVLVRIHQLAHGHAQQQRLAVALRDAEAAQQLGRYLARLVVGIQQMARRDGVNAVVVGQRLLPVRLVLAPLVSPRIASPGLIPHPVAVQLLQSLTVGQLVCRIGPVPVGGLRIEVQTLRVVYAVHGLYRLLDEGRTRPAPRFQIGQDMYVVNVHRCRRG